MPFERLAGLGGINDAVHFGADQSYELRHAIIRETGDIPTYMQTVRIARAPDKEIKTRFITRRITDPRRQRLRIKNQALGKIKRHQRRPGETTLSRPQA